MADVPFATFAFATTSGTTNRTMPTRLNDVINVKDFGATGNGSTDDSPAIQNAINAAFGTAGSPHAVANAHLNKLLFFPEGKYFCDTVLTFTQVYGGRIVGSGRGTTTLLGGSTGCMKTNGVEECHFEGFNLDGNDGGPQCFDLDWNGSGTVNLRNNTFSDMLFYNVQNGTPGVGIRIGNSGNGGTGNLFLQCYWSQVKTGVEVAGNAATGNSVISGNVQNVTDIGIKVTRGQMAVVQGTGFQQCTNWDIKTTSTAAAYPLSSYGCRSESENHLYSDAITPVLISGVTHTWVGGKLIEAHGLALVEASITEGVVAAREGALLTVQNCNFINTTFLDAPAASLWFTPTNTYTANIELEGIKISSGGTLAIIAKQRRFTSNGSTITTLNYVAT